MWNKEIYHSITLLESAWSKKPKDLKPCIQFFNEDGVILYNYRGGSLPKPSEIVDNCNSINSEFHGLKLKDKYKLFYKLYGITPSNLKNIMAGVVCKEIKKCPEWDNLFYSRVGWTKQSGFWDYMEYEDLMQQCRKDGIANIIPIVGRTGMSPSELKKQLGSGLWKALCKNSYSRNKLIANLELFKEIKISEKDKEDLWNILSMDTSVMKYGSYGCYLTQEHINQISKKYGFKSYKSMRKNRQFENIRNIIRDVSMSLDVDYKMAWSIRRIEEEHARMMRERLAMQARWEAQHDARYAELMKVHFPDVVPGLEVYDCAGGIEAIPMLSMQEVEKEGQEMHHCVGTYYTRCATGNYAVYSLRKGDLRATLGLDKGYGKWGVQQMYHACNEDVTDKDFTAAASMICARLNKAKEISDATKQTETV